MKKVKATKATMKKTKEVQAIPALNTLSKDELVKLYNKHNTGPKVKSFKDKAQAVRVVAKLLRDKGIAVEKPTVKATKKTTGTKRAAGGPSKMQKIRDLFTGQSSATLDEIIKASGFDKRNAQSAMSILKMPRTPKPLQVVTVYDREAKTYTLAGAEAPVKKVAKTPAKKTSKKVTRKVPRKK